MNQMFNTREGHEKVDHKYKCLRVVDGGRLETIPAKPEFLFDFSSTLEKFR